FDPRSRVAVPDDHHPVAGDAERVAGERTARQVAERLHAGPLGPAVRLDSGSVETLSDDDAAVRGDVLGDGAVDSAGQVAELDETGRMGIAPGGRAQDLTGLLGPRRARADEDRPVAGSRRREIPNRTESGGTEARRAGREDPAAGLPSGDPARLA